MRAETLRRFFAGEATAGELATELQGTWTLLPTGARRFSCTELDDAFLVKPGHLVRVCDAVLAGQLAPALLESLGACLVGTTESWTWDEEDDIAVRVAYAWDTPAINYKLTMSTTAKYRHWLLTGENIFGPEDVHPMPGASPA